MAIHSKTAVAASAGDVDCDHDEGVWPQIIAAIARAET